MRTRGLLKDLFFRWTSRVSSVAIILIRAACWVMQLICARDWWGERRLANVLRSGDSLIRREFVFVSLDRGLQLPTILRYPSWEQILVYRRWNAFECYSRNSHRWYRLIRGSVYPLKKNVIAKVFFIQTVLGNVMVICLLKEHFV